MSQPKPSGLKQPGRLPRPSTGLPQPPSKMRPPLGTGSSSSSVPAAAAAKLAVTSSAKHPSQSGLTSKTTSGRQSASGLAASRGSSPNPPRPASKQQTTAPAPQTVAADHNFCVGDRVLVSGSKPGVIRFLGATSFAKGEWAGVELEVPEGKNDGSVGGVPYFTCKPLHGVFAKPQKLERRTTLVTGKPVQNATSERKAMPRGSKSGSDSSLQVGDKVLVGGAKSGTLRYIGKTEFAQGVWAGVQLDEPLGKNDGAVAGKRYFQCQPKYGLFAPVHKVEKIGPVEAFVLPNPVVIETSKMVSIPATEAAAAPAVEQKVMAVRSDSSHKLQEVVHDVTVGRMEIASTSSDSESILADLRAQLKQAEEHRALLQHELELEKRKSEDLQCRLEEENVTRVEHEEGSTSLSFLDSEVSAIKKQTEQLKQELEDSEAQHQLSLKTIRKLEADLQQAISVSTQTQQELEKANNDIASKQTVIGELEAKLKEKDSALERDEAKLQSEVAQLQTLLEEERQQLQKLLEEERQEHNSSMEERDLELAESKVSVEVLEQEVEKQRSAAVSMKEEISVLQHQLASTNSQLKASTESVTTDRQQVEQLRADLSNKEALITSTHQRIDELTSELACCQEQAKQQATVAAQSSDELTKARKEIETIQSQIGAEKSESLKVRQALDLMGVEKTNVTDRCNSLESELKENQSKLALETGKSEKLQGDMESLTQKLEDMQVLLLTSQEKAERYSEDKTILETRISELLQSSGGSSERLSMLDVELKARDREIDELKSSLSETNAKLNATDRELSTVKDQHSSAQTAVEALTAKLEEENQTKEDFVSQLKKTQEETVGERQRLLSLQSELEDSKAAALTTSTELASAKQMITALTESESNLKLKLQELEKSVGEHKVAVLSAQAETESRTTTEQELRSELQTKSDDLKQKEAELQLAVTQLKDVECSLDGLKKSRTELENEVLRLQACLKELEDRVSVEQSKSTLVEERNRQLELEKSELEEKYNTQSASLQDAEHKIAVQLEEAAKLNIEVTSEKEQTHDLRIQLKSSQDTVDLLTADKSQLERQISELFKQSGDSSERTTYLEEQLKERNHELENLRLSSSETQDRLATLEEQLVTAKAGQALEQSTTTQLRQELSEEKSTKELLEGQLKSCQLDLATEQERNRELELELSAKSSLAVAAKEEADSAQREVVTLRENTIQLEENMRRMQALLDEEQTARTSLGAEKEASSQLTQDLASKLEDKTRELQAKDEELQISVKRLDEKTGELRAAETQRADLAAKTSALEEMVSRLDEEVKLQGKHAADVEEHKKQLETGLQEHLRNAENIANNVATLQKELEEKDSALTSLKQANTDLEGRSQILAAEVESLKDVKAKELQDLEAKHCDDVKFHDTQLQAKVQQCSPYQEVVELEKARSELSEMIAALEGARADMAALEQKHVVVMEERLRETQDKEEAEKVKERMVGELTDALREKQEAVEKCERLVSERDATAGERDKAIKESTVHSEKMKELTSAKRNLDEKLKSKEEECDILSEQIGELTQELQQSTQLADERLKAITALESEKNTFENRLSLLSEALADAETKASKSVAVPALDFNNIGEADEVLLARAKELEVEMAEVQMENESLNNQVEFLNTVIVDLQRKNEWSQKRLTAMEQGIILDESDLQLMEDIGEDFTETGPPERLFCDICDVFDEHDTADCPQQATEEHVESSHGGQRGVERPYCDNCEVFGHWTENCDDNETF